MGYTHYFTTSGKSSLTWDEMHQCRADIQTVLDKKLVCFENDQPSWPPENHVRYNSDNDTQDIHIRFNGILGGGHETFLFDSSEEGFNFCKTARKSYDIVVCKVLFIIKHYFGDEIKLSSDGFSNHQPNKPYKVGDTVKYVDLDGNWAAALRFVNKKYNTQYKFIVSSVHGDKGQYFSYTMG